MPKSIKSRLMLKQHGRCCWCGRSMSEELATIEHIVPLCHDGMNHYDNKALAHKHCNNRRGSNTTIEPHPSPVFDFVRDRLRYSKRGYWTFGDPPATGPKA